MNRIGILLSGCGVYDGAEIQEAVLTMLAIEEAGGEYVCISIDKEQFHTINHLTGEEQPVKRNMMEEAARIARGEVVSINDIKPSQLDGLVIPGGFGSAKNFTSWAFKGSESDILPEVKLLLVNLVNIGCPIVALCVSPVVVAKAFEGASFSTRMTIGSLIGSSPYDIDSFKKGLSTTGVSVTDKKVTEIEVDEVNRVITAPCYMMDTSLLGVRNNVKQAIDALFQMIKN